MSSDSEHWTDVADPRVDHPGAPATDVADLLGRAWRFLEYSSLYLAFVGVAEVLVVIYVMGLSLNLAPVIVFLVIFAVYANDRLVDLDADEVASPERTAFTRRYTRELYVAAAISYGLAGAMSVLAGPLAFMVTLLPGLVWLAYSLGGITLPSVEVERLKEVPVVSSVVVAGTWALVVVMIPLLFADAAVTPRALVLVAYLGLAAFTSTEIANVRDVLGDAESGVSTLPTVLGVSRTRRILYGVTVSMAAMLAVAVAVGVLSAFLAAILSLGVLGLLGVVGAVGRVADVDQLTVWAECTRIPVFVVLAVLALL